jgi:L-lactate utilization protein LutB
MAVHQVIHESAELTFFHLAGPLGIVAKRGEAERFRRLSLLKKRAAHIRWKGINFADKYLIEFESNFSRRGGKVHWAFNEKELADTLREIIRKQNLKLNISLYPTSDPSIFVKLQKEAPGKQAWLLKAGYLMADPGGVSVYLPPSFCLPEDDDLIFVASIDRVLPSIASLETLIPLQQEFKKDAREGLMHLFFASSVRERNIHVIITENKVTELMAVKSHRSLLHCIDCNQCCLSDPERRLSDEIKRQALDHTGELLTDSFSYPLDGQQTALCPVMINFEKLILLNRQRAVIRNFVPSSEKWFYFFWKKAVVRKNKIPVPGRSLDFYVNRIFIKSELKLRTPLPPAQKTFSQWWKEHTGMN